MGKRRAGNKTKLEANGQITKRSRKEKNRERKGGEQVDDEKRRGVNK